MFSLQLGFFHGPAGQIPMSCPPESRLLLLFFSSYPMFSNFTVKPSQERPNTSRHTEHTYVHIVSTALCRATDRLNKQCDKASNMGAAKPLAMLLFRLGLPRASICGVQAR